MSTEFITDKVLTASQFVECLTGNYYTRCDTNKAAQPSGFSYLISSCI